MEERWRRGVGLLVAQPVYPSWWKCCFLAHVGWGIGPNCGLCLCVKQQFGEPILWETLEWVLESAPNGHCILLLGDSNDHVSNDSETWKDVIGKNGPLDLNPNCVQLMEFCASHSLYITNTMCSHKNVQKCTWSIQLALVSGFITSLGWYYNVLVSPWKSWWSWWKRGSGFLFSEPDKQ